MPDWTREIRALLSGLSLEPTREFEIIEELGQHCEDRYEELLAARPAAGGGAAPWSSRRSTAGSSKAS